MFSKLPEKRSRIPIQSLTQLSRKKIDFSQKKNIKRWPPTCSTATQNRKYLKSLNKSTSHQRKYTSRTTKAKMVDSFDYRWKFFATEVKNRPPQLLHRKIRFNVLESALTAPIWWLNIDKKILSNNKIKFLVPTRETTDIISHWEDFWRKTQLIARQISQDERLKKKWFNS